jgi:hypothetical protein
MRPQHGGEPVVPERGGHDPDDPEQEEERLGDILPSNRSEENGLTR